MDPIAGYDELLNAMVQRKLVATEERLWAAFCQIDHDGNGYIEVPELRNVLRGENQAQVEVKRTKGDRAITLLIADMTRTCRKSLRRSTRIVMAGSTTKSSSRPSLTSSLF